VSLPTSIIHTEVASSSLSLDVLACRQVHSSFLHFAWPDSSVPRDAQAANSEWSCFYENLLNIARALCPLEALAHRTEEVAAALVVHQAEFADLESRVPWKSFPVPLRIFAGVALAQRTWLDEVCFLTLGEMERSDILSESPAWSVESFL